ncbi:Hypothetical_protein [Hexamita inflata]|uniref:Hypothetical_protein n=1 Tax=Hexamita inflata TaxID=28002 RepID=A0AA86NVH7_9EUKA|nr:Hypothetical protein HINF_LOCUS13106 [Hexamita inflata]
MIYLLLVIQFQQWIQIQYTIFNVQIQLDQIQYQSYLQNILLLNNIQKRLCLDFVVCQVQCTSSLINPYFAFRVSEQTQLNSQLFETAINKSLMQNQSIYSQIIISLFCSIYCVNDVFGSKLKYIPVILGAFPVCTRFGTQKKNKLQFSFCSRQRLTCAARNRQIPMWITMALSKLE